MKFLESKFIKLFNIVMEALSEEDEKYLDAATYNYLNDVSSIEDFKDLDKNEEISSKLKRVIKGSHFLKNEKLVEYLESIGLDIEKHSSIIKNILSAKDKHASDWLKLIGNRENKLKYDEFKNSKTLDSIAAHYKFSDEFMTYLLEFEGTNNGHMGKGELLLACTIDGAQLSTRSITNKENDEEKGEINGDIIINNERYEIKGEHAKIGDTSVQANLLIKEIISMIKNMIEEKAEFLVNKEIIPAFFAGKNNSVPICTKQIEYKTEKRGIAKIKEKQVVMTANFLNVSGMPKIDDLFKEQFKYTELPSNKSDEDWWFDIKNRLLKQIFVMVFYTLYGDIGTSANINRIFYDDPTDLRINIEEYKKLIFKTAMDWYSNYGKKFKEIIIIDTKRGSNTVCCISATEKNYDRYINFFDYPSFGAKEGASRSDACLHGPAHVAILASV